MDARLALQWQPFSGDALWAAVRGAAGIDRRAAEPLQVRYLSSFLSNHETSARSMLVEYPYTDRHYLTEYQDYYATALLPPPAKTTRIHFFQGDYDEQILLALANAVDEGVEPFAELRGSLQQDYLGFVVVRPLPSAPIGRTVLRAWRDQDRTFGPPSAPHRVHILGLSLKVNGVQFHQQDRAVGACATAAVWCALSAVVRRDGGRSPTPSAITARANQSAPEHRAFPAVSGLTRQQMIGAIAAMGYSPDVVKPSPGSPDFFYLVLKTYLRSGVPVVLQLLDEEVDEGHAVTVVGYREVATEGPEEDGGAIIRVATSLPSYPLRARAISRLYVHDDRLGPYARMKLRGDEHGEPVLQFWPHSRGGMDDVQIAAQVSCALVPLYPKIRMSGSDLCLLAGWLMPLATLLVGGPQQEKVRVEPFFALGGDYASELLRGLPIHADRRAALLQQLLLSRYVGVIRFFLSDSWVLDAICDPTDILRDPPAFAHLLAFIPAAGEHIPLIKDYTGGRALVG